MTIKHLIKLTLIFTVLAAGLVSCRKASDAKKDSIINVSLTGDISTLDPAISYDSVSASIIYQTYDMLFQYHYLKRPYTIVPHLAEDLPLISNEGLTYTFKIKKNIQYHKSKAIQAPKRFVKAQDFINQIKRLAFAETKSNGWFLFENKIQGLDEFREKAKNLDDFFNFKVSGLKAIDDHTLEINLKEPYPQLLYALAMSFTAPIPKEVITFYDNNLNEEIVGTGPFKLRKWNKNLSVILDRNDYYWEELYPGQGDRFANDNNLLADAGKKLPFVSGIKYHIMKEDQPRWLNFLSKKTDILTIPKDNFNTAISKSGTLTDELKKKGIRLQVAPTLTYWWISFNMNDPLVGKNKNFRYAIAHAINIKKYIKLFTNNTGQQAFSIYPPGIPGYNPNNKVNFKYDVNLAKTYLEKAGFPNGEGLPEIIFDTRGNSSTSRQRADFIKNELGKIGIKIKINLNTFPGFLKKSRQGDLQMWLDGWALDYPDSENILQLLITKNHPPGPNSTYYSNKKFDELFMKLKFLPNGTEKYELMTEMESMVSDDMPWIMLFYNRSYVLYYDYVKNYRFSGLINNSYKYLRLAK